MWLEHEKVFIQIEGYVSNSREHIFGRFRRNLMHGKGGGHTTLIPLFKCKIYKFFKYKTLQMFKFKLYISTNKNFSISSNVNVIDSSKVYKLFKSKLYKLCNGKQYKLFKCTLKDCSNPIFRSLDFVKFQNALYWQTFIIQRHQKWRKTVKAYLKESFRTISINFVIWSQVMEFPPFLSNHSSKECNIYLSPFCDIKYGQCLQKLIFIGPRCPWGPIYGSWSLYSLQDYVET